MQKLSIFSVLILSIGHLAGKPQPTRVDVYKTASETELKVFIFEPDGHKTKDKRPCAVFFFGGGWTGGTPTQFYPHCAYLASRGMVAIADYRVKSRQKTTPFECVKDGSLPSAGYEKMPKDWVLIPTSLLQAEVLQEGM